MAERLHKYLARAGVASRRRAEELIQEGRISVNNQVVRELGTKVEAGKDLVTVDGQLVSPPEEHGYFLLYKPVGVVTTMDDPQGRPTVARYVEELGRRVFPVGRLDFDAEGALLFMDDGDLANQLTHPRYGVKRTYLAKVKGSPTPEALERLVAGVRLEDGEAKAVEASVFEEAERNTWIKLTVSEGRPHMVKRMCAAIGHPVQRLYRPAQAGISVQGLRPGEVRPLKEAEVERLRAVATGSAPQQEELSLPPRRHGHGAPGLDEDEIPVTVVQRGPARTVSRPRPGRAFGERGEEPRRRGAFGDRAFGGAEAEGPRKRERPAGPRTGRETAGGARGGERRAFGGGRREDRETSRGGDRGGARGFGGGERTGGRREFGGGERTGGRSFGAGGGSRGAGGERGGGRSFGAGGGSRGAGGERTGGRREFGGGERGGGRSFGAGGGSRGAGGERGGGRSFGAGGGSRGAGGERGGGRSFGAGGGSRTAGERTGGRREFGGGERGGGRSFGAGGGSRGAGGERTGGRSFGAGGGSRGAGGERGGGRSFGAGGGSRGAGGERGGGRSFGTGGGSRGPGGGRGKFGPTGGSRGGTGRGGPGGRGGGGRGPGRSGGGRNGGRGGSGR